jgi:hypothetical protein
MTSNCARTGTFRTLSNSVFINDCNIWRCVGRLTGSVVQCMRYEYRYKEKCPEMRHNVPQRRGYEQGCPEPVPAYLKQMAVSPRGKTVWFRQSKESVLLVRNPWRCAVDGLKMWLEYGGLYRALHLKTGPRAWRNEERILFPLVQRRFVAPTFSGFVIVWFIYVGVLETLQ